MAVVIESECASTVPPAKLYKMFLLESHIHIPKILPQCFKGINIIEGDGKYKGIKQTIFAEGMPFKCMTHKIELVDEDKLIYKWSEFDGEPWLDGLDRISYEFQMVPHGDGSMSKYKATFHPKSGCTFDETKIDEYKVKVEDVFRAIEAYISANPNA